MQQYVQEEDENGIGDVDLFVLTQDKDALEVNAKWLQHLQVGGPFRAACCTQPCRQPRTCSCCVASMKACCCQVARRATSTALVCLSHSLLAAQERLLGEDGHPRKVQDAEDPHRMGLVLEWVYGTIVSTAEKARDGAKRSLGVPETMSAGCCGVWMGLLTSTSMSTSCCLKAMSAADMSVAGWGLCSMLGVRSILGTG